VIDAEKLVAQLLDEKEKPVDPKDFVADIKVPHVNPETQGGLFEVSGSHGTIYCDPVTGDVVRYEPDSMDDPEGYGDIVRVNLPEYTQWLDRLEKKFPGAGAAQDGCDILFIGFWTQDGGYSEPEEDAREDREWTLAQG
jgi:hypothetical protein